MLKMTMEALFRPEDFRTPVDVAGQAFYAGVNAERRARALGRDVTAQFALIEVPGRGSWYVAYLTEETLDGMPWREEDELRAWADLQQQCAAHLARLAKIHAIVNRA